MKRIIFCAIGAWAFVSASTADSLAASTPFSWSGYYVGAQIGSQGGNYGSETPGYCGPFSNITNLSDLAFANAFASSVGSNCYTGTTPEGASVPFFDVLLPPPFTSTFVAYTGTTENNNWGFSAGGQVGFNRQVGGIVFGLESDFAGVGNGGHKETTSFDVYRTLVYSTMPDCGTQCDLLGRVATANATFEHSVEWLSTIRGRLGTAVGANDRVFLYGTAGIAFAGVARRASGVATGSFLTDSNDCNRCYFADSKSSQGIALGYTVGAGVEFAVTNRLSIAAQYLYAHIVDRYDDSLTFYSHNSGQFDVAHVNDSLKGIQSITLRANFRLGTVAP